MRELEEEINADLSCVDWYGAPICFACVAGVGVEGVRKKTGEVK